MMPKESQSIVDAMQDRPRWRLRFRLALLLVATLVQLTRIVQVQSTTGETPFLSANDRSRWCTVLSLAMNGNYIIDDIVQIRDPQTKRRTWYTIDMVQHRGEDGKQHFYSSKPPLLPTIFSGIYIGIKHATGATLTKDTFLVARIMLVVVNLIPLVALWWLMLHWADRYVSQTVPFILLASFAVLGTFLSSFANTLNNHLPAAVATAFSLQAIEIIVLYGDLRRRWFVLAGLATSFAAANELPALSWVAGVAVLLLTSSPRRTLYCYLPALLPVALAFWGTNYAAHGTWRPAYSQRAVGAQIATWETSLPSNLGELQPQPIIEIVKPLGYELSDRALIRQGRRDGVWELWDEVSQWRIALRAISHDQLGIYQWGDWYDYPNSYWIEGRKKGVDIGEPNLLKYAFHCLVGHHGIFSLTPVWLFTVLGAIALLAGRVSMINQLSMRWLVLAICAISVIVLGFYLTRPLEDRNYGGVCCGLRWSFWLIPLWYWVAVSGSAAVFSGRWSGLAIALLTLCLVISIFSTNYPWSNPWTSPWIYQWTLPQGQACLTIDALWSSLC